MKYIALITILMLTTLAKARKYSCGDLFGLERPSEEDITKTVSDLRELKILLNGGSDLAKIEYPKKYQEALLVMDESELKERMRIGGSPSAAEEAPLFDGHHTVLQKVTNEILNQELFLDFLKKYEFVDMNHQNSMGELALGKAVQQANEMVFEVMLSRGADVNMKDREGRTALYYAVNSGRDKFVKKLFIAGAEINSQDKEGQTALYVAVKSGRVSLVKLLIELDADVDIPDYTGMEPMHWAEMNGNEEVVDILKKASKK